MSGLSGLADFIRALGHLGARDDQARSEIAGLLGLDPAAFAAREAPAPSRDPLPEEREPEPPAPVSEPDEARDEEPPAPAAPRTLAGDELPSALQPVRASLQRMPDWVRQAPGLEPEEEDPAAGPSPEPLLDPALARAVLGGALATTTHDGELWVEEAVRRIATGQPFTEVPRRPRPTLLRGVQVLVDRGTGMLPFHEDVKLLLVQIRSVVGEPLVRVLQFAGSPLLRVGPGAKRSWTAYDRQLPEPGTVVVAVTDLGIGEMPGVPGALPLDWLAFAARVREHGCALRLLVPYPEDRWPASLRGQLRVLRWDRGTGVHSVRRVLAAEREIAVGGGAT